VFGGVSLFEFKADRHPVGATPIDVLCLEFVKLPALQIDPVTLVRAPGIIVGATIVRNT